MVVIKNISIIGLGNLGLPLALTFASKEFNVVGYDVNKALVKKFNQEYVLFLNLPFKTCYQNIDLTLYLQPTQKKR